MYVATKELGNDLPCSSFPTTYFDGGNTGQISADDIIDFMEDELDMTDVPGFKIRHMIEDVTNKETINRREFAEVFSHSRMLSCLEICYSSVLE